MNDEKIGGTEMSKKGFEKFHHDLDKIYNDLLKITEEYNECLNFYSGLMHEELKKIGTYFEENDLLKQHNKAKKISLAQVFIFYSNASNVRKK